MDELTNVNEVVEESAPVEESTAEGFTDAELDAMWADDDDDGFVETDTAEEADQQTTEPAETEEAEPTEVEQPQDDGADQYLELKHFDEVKKVTKEEAKELAQKGMDYDRIRGKLNDANSELEKFKQYETFLNEIKGDFNSIEDLMDDTRARLAMDKEGITYEKALEKVKTVNQPNTATDKEAVLKELRESSIQSFALAHPDLSPNDIPEEVWKDVMVTNNMDASYAKYQAKKLAEENAVLKKNAENKARSIGSMKSAGNKSQRDEIDEMWYDDDY